MPKIETLGTGAEDEFNVFDKVRLFHDEATNEAGMQIKMTNKTGGATTKGYLIHPSAGTDRAFDYVPLDSPNVTGVVYEAGVVDGSECWVWISGLVEVYFYGATTRNHIARMGVTADGGAAGQAISEVYPVSPFATDKHFQEIGHVFESIGATGLALTGLHFN